MAGSTRDLDRDKITTNEATDCFSPVFCDAAYQLGVTDDWLEMRIGTFVQNGFKTFATFYSLDFSKKLRQWPLSSGHLER